MSQSVFFLICAASGSYAVAIVGACDKAQGPLECGRQEALGELGTTKDETSLLQVSHKVSQGSSRASASSEVRAHEGSIKDRSEGVRHACSDMKCNYNFCKKAFGGEANFRSAKGLDPDLYQFSDKFETAMIKGSSRTCPTLVGDSDCCEEKYYMKEARPEGGGFNMAGIEIFYRLMDGGCRSAKDICRSCAAKLEGIYDLNGHRVKRNAAYHAVVKLGITDGMGDQAALIVEMAPKEIVAFTDTEPEKLNTGEDFTMFVADKRAGFSAGCKKDQVFQSPSLRIKDMSLGDFARQINAVTREWSPHKYNCQHFATDVLAELAQDPAEMRAFLDTLTHDAAELTKGNMGMEKFWKGYNKDLATAAGGIARAGGLLTNIPDASFKDLTDPGSAVGKIFAPILDYKIYAARVYYFESVTSHVLTSSESRKKDYDRRQEQMCNMIGEHKEGRTMSSSEYPMRYIL